MEAAHLRAELVAVLATAGGPLTETDARIAVASKLGSQDRPVVAEQVYHAFMVLHRRGVVRRVEERPSRQAQWELAVRFGETPPGVRPRRPKAAER
ncbi:hypothetical protein [Mycobacterium paragordonae]|uniref:hypothetical protein n=1 Tax=Mycobacterium paragordonae TaxID=1389713 RepID=UPI00106003D9|nr:hypothetical protein [Mycobacterium paragordonae]TDL03285.1 hypothetical protein EUA05_25110 [Mycobacterium paragordonae]